MSTARTGRHVALMAAAALTGSLLLGACASVRDDLGTSADNCYVDLPVAAAAVHHVGHLKGVRQLTEADVHSLRTPRLYEATLDLTNPKVSHVCLIAYSGTFQTGTVSHSIGDRHGHLAIVAVTYPDRRLVGTLIVHHQAFGLGHGHLGFAAPALRPAQPAGSPAAGSGTEVGATLGLPGRRTASSTG